MPDDHDDVDAGSAPQTRGRSSVSGPSPEVVVIVLTGGASTRMGRHKPALEVGGRPIIERVVAAARPRRILVVGSDVAVPPGVTTIPDTVPRGGPVSGLATGMAHLAHLAHRPDAAEPPDQHHRHDYPTPGVVVVLAGDLPWLTSAFVDRLVSGLEAGAGSHPAAVAVASDADGRRNWLCSAWRREALCARLAGLGEPAGQSMRQLAQGVALTVVLHTGEAMDVDTPAELARARRFHAHDL